MQTTSRLHVLDLSIEVVRRIAPIIAQVRSTDRDLGDQMRRAVQSIALNLGEANASHAGNRRARLFTALGSTQETRTALRVALAWGYLIESQVEPLDQQLDRIAAMTWRLAHPRPAVKGSSLGLHDGLDRDRVAAQRTPRGQRGHQGGKTQ